MTRRIVKIFLMLSPRTQVDLMIKIFRGYLRTLKNYFCTPKARHDFKDYARAVAIIFLTSMIVHLLVRR